MPSYLWIVWMIGLILWGQPDISAFILYIRGTKLLFTNLAATSAITFLLKAEKYRDR